MPWNSGAEFAKKHDKHLHGAKANKARRVAEGMLRNGVPEGEAIATGIARAKGQKRRKRNHPFKRLEHHG